MLYLIKLFIFASILGNSASSLFKSVTPSNYKLEITTNIPWKAFSGKVNIGLNITNEIQSFPIHALNLERKEISLTKIDSSDEEIPVTVTVDEENDLWILNATKTLTPGDYNLFVSYETVLSDSANRGFYLSGYPYYDNSTKSKYLATTYLKETSARRAFPCFDDPAFKTTFDISIICPKTYTTVLSNTKGIVEDVENTDLKKVTFHTTPPMSTYLVAFLVSEFKCIEKEFSGILVQTCARPEAENTTNLAVEVTPEILKCMKNYTGFGYEDMSLDKLTQAAIPDFDAAGMANWGLVTYKETSLLWDEEESSISYKKNVIATIADQISRQWFGNLVAPDSWSNIFLNDGLATYFGYYIPQIIYPNWEFDKHFVIEHLHKALLDDSLETSIPLASNITDPEETEMQFRNMLCSKSASVIRMMQHLLGADIFKNGVATYVKNHNASNLWEIFNSAGNDIPLPYDGLFSTIRISWTQKSGYPLISVTSVGGDVFISQEQFLLNGTTNSVWYVPITYTLSTDVTDFAKTTTKAWLIPGDNLILPGVLKNADWIILNNQQTGFYRVSYDDHLLSNIFNTLISNVSTIDEISRSQIVDDLLNLARAGKKNYDDVLKFLTFLKTDDSFYSWSSAFNGFEFLLQRLSDKTKIIAFKNYVADLIAVLKTSIPIEEEKSQEMDILKQVLVQTWACLLGDSKCINYSKKSFADYKLNATKVNPNLRSIVYCNALRYSETPSEDYLFLFIKYLDANVFTERVTILQALGCVNDTDTRRSYLRQLFNYNIRYQDTKYVFSSVASSGAEGVTDVIRLLIDSHKLLERMYRDYTTILPYAIAAVANLVNSQEQLDLLEVLHSSADLSDALKPKVSEAIAKATTNLKITQKIEEMECFGMCDNSAFSNEYHLISMLIFVLCNISMKTIFWNL